MSRRFDVRELLVLVVGLIVLALASWGLVAWLAPRSPHAVSGTVADWEPGFKDLIRGQLEWSLNASLVDKPKTGAALAAIAKRLQDALPEPLPYKLEIVVTDSPQVNALTFPGGLIVVHSGLLERATPEETAAVLAHEMGHVAHHDSADLIVKTLVVASAAALTTDSQAVREAVQLLSRTAFSREVEDRADAFALDLLARARIRPSRLGDVLASTSESFEGKFVRKHLPFLQDHPDLDERVQKARGAPFAGPEEPFDVDWDAVQQELRNK